jgi:hemerythrin
MASFVWSEKYAIGIETIDLQHQRLIQMINDLQEALIAERGQQALADIVGRMLDYAAYHFSTEEALLRDHGYELYGSHKKEHEAFTVKAQELKKRVDNKRFVLTLEVITFLREWLATHILVNDKKYAPFMLGAGLR